MSSPIKIRFWRFALSSEARVRSYARYAEGKTIERWTRVWKWFWRRENLG